MASLLAVNDFFVGQKTHLSHATDISCDSKETSLERDHHFHRAWCHRVMAMFSPGKELSISLRTKKSRSSFPEIYMDAEYYNILSGTFSHNTTGTSLVFGKVSSHTPLVIVSQMAENGVIFSDGIENDFLEFNSGKTATISLAERKGLLVV
jgi:hypothetical protein